jgi:hypothetical protein
MDSPEAAKPSSVVLSVRLLWGALALGVLRLLLESPKLAATPNLMVMAGGFVVALAIYALLIAKISSGRNWARMIFLVLMLADLLLSMPGVVGGFGRAPLGASMALAGAGLQVWALVLLFTDPGKAWFQKKAAG